MDLMLVRSSLLALPLVAVSCSTDEPSDVGSGSTSENTGGTETDPTSVDPSTGSSTDVTTGDPSNTSSTTAQSGSDSSGGMTGIDCESRCAEQASCGEVAELNCLSNCIDTQAAADWVGEPCGDAYRSFQECQTLRTCEQIDAGTGCENELAALPAACGPLAPDGCQAVCPKWVACGSRDETFCTTNCALSVGFAAAQGQACAEASDATFACEADLDCRTSAEEACAEEIIAAQEACEA